jgi:hypothetical protein
MYEYNPYNQSFIAEGNGYFREPRGNMPYNSYEEQGYNIERQQLPFGGGQPGYGGYGGYPGGPPTSPPPYYTPQPTGGYNQGSIRRCLYRMTYVWLDSGRSFWFYPTSISRNSVDGYRWRPRQGRWVYFGINRDQIRSFRCY